MNYQEFDHNGLRYLVRYPEGFQQSKEYPVIVFLHGAGTRGEDMQVLVNNPFFKDIQRYADFPFVVVAPLCTENTWFELWERLMALVKHTASLPYADSSRIYLMGASMGGYGTWQLAMSMPEYFAAIIPICGGGMYWNADRLQNIPAWAFHGALDPEISPEESQKMVDAVNSCGGWAKLTIYPHREHNAWSDTYANPEVFSWLLQHKNRHCVLAENPYHDAQLYG